MKKRLLSTLDSHPEWGDAHIMRDALTHLRLVFQESGSEMSSCGMFFGKSALQERGLEAGAGQRKWSHRAAPTTASTSPPHEEPWS